MRRLFSNFSATRIRRFFINVNHRRRRKITIPLESVVTPQIGTTSQAFSRSRTFASTRFEWRREREQVQEILAPHIPVERKTQNLIYLKSRLGKLKHPSLRMELLTQFFQIAIDPIVPQKIRKQCADMVRDNRGEIKNWGKVKRKLPKFEN